MIKIHYKYGLFLTYIVFFSCLLFFIVSCGKESSCFKGSGNTVTELRTITTGVTKIIVEDNIDLHLIQGNDVQLKLEGGKNLLPYINSDITNDVLTLSSDNKCGFFRDNKKTLIAYLTLPNIEHIDLLGQGNLTNSGILKYPSFSIEASSATGSVNLSVQSDFFSVGQHSGVADFTISGTANQANFYTLGNGWMYADKLYAKSVHVNHAGSGDIFVQPLQSLLIELAGSGNIIYYGNPDVTVSVNKGSGKIIKK